LPAVDRDDDSGAGELPGRLAQTVDIRGDAEVAAAASSPGQFSVGTVPDVAPPAGTVAAAPSSRRSQPIAPTPSVFDVPRPRFDEKAELGRGGMGRVVEALDRPLDRTVAIKHMLGTDGAGLARFEREVRITARLQHPGVVPILDVGRDDDGQPFYVMRKIEGEPLSDRVKAADSVRDRLALIPAVLGAIDAAAYAHAQGVVHRDIKPWNILLGSFGESLLIDWGLARELDSGDEVPLSHPRASSDGDAQLTRVGHAYGTPGYMAPEQARGEPADRRADVYSLGATLYFVLTRSSPFSDSAGATVAIQRAGSGETPDLAKVPEDVPVELTAIITKALAPDRALRYADAGELAADLRRYIAGQLVAAHRYTVPQLMLRWVRRHKLVTAVSTAALVLVGVIGAVAVRSVVAERDEARAARALAEGRNEEMLLDRARTLVQSDPTSAVALLRGLSPRSSRWPAAREIVRAAVPLGVERALVADTSEVHRLAFSTNGQLAALSGDHAIRIHDIARGTSRVVGQAEGNFVAWVDEHTVVVSHETVQGVVALVDIDRGTQTTHSFESLTQTVTFEGRVFALVEQGTVHELYRDGSVQTAGTDIRSMTARGGRLALVAHTEAVIYDATSAPRRISIDASGIHYESQLSPDGSRLAVLTRDRVREWDLSSAELLLDEAVREEKGQGIVYAGERLYVALLDGAFYAPTQRAHPTEWLGQGEPLGMASYADGAVFATKAGSVALATRLGIVPLPHRPFQPRAIAVEPSGRWLAFAGIAGAIQLIDLNAVTPRWFHLEPFEVLLSVNRTHALLAHSDTAVRAGGQRDLTLLELATGVRRTIGSVEFGSGGELARDSVVVWTAGNRPRLTIYRLTGEIIDEIPDVRASAFGVAIGGTGESVFYGTRDGDIIEQRLDIAVPRRILARLPNLAHVGGTTPIARMHALGGELMLATFIRGTTGLYWIDSAGIHELAAPVPGFLQQHQRDADGVWWLTADFKDLYRLIPGRPPERIPVGEPIRFLRLQGNEVWASSKETVFRLDRRTAAVLSRTRTDQASWRGVRGGYVIAGPLGAEVIMPLENVRRELRLPVQPAAVTADYEGTAVAASVLDGATARLAVWLDDVPTDPSLVPAYIARLTNASLRLGSDAVIWDH
jgi:hypothetical protein